MPWKIMINLLNIAKNAALEAADLLRKSKKNISGSKTENSTYTSPELPESKFLSIIYLFWLRSPQNMSNFRQWWFMSLENFIQK